MSRAAKPPKPKRVRVFVGLKFDLNDQIKPLMADLADCALDTGSKLRLAPPENMHITLKFLGSVLESNLGPIDTLLSQVAGRHQCMELQVKGIGFFKNSIWIGVAQSPELTALALDLGQGFSALGFQPEQKGFVPHVTVARFGRDAKIKLSSLTQKYADQDWGSLLSQDIQLYRSDTLPEGARYSVLNNYKLIGVMGS
ncbi:MAG: RNA 2',3'-cyclic phosphodiesterase, partial [Gammaproteobacteria bacterium]|nr:RNA 2',3'-cyclic phosphodiesterase [Gammaproteobacteria bacterium]